MTPWDEYFHEVRMLQERLRAEGECLGWTSDRLSFYRLEGAVYCIRSATQVDYCCPWSEWEAYQTRFPSPLLDKPLPYPD